MPHLQSRHWLLPQARWAASALTAMAGFVALHPAKAQYYLENGTVTVPGTIASPFVGTGMSIGNNSTASLVVFNHGIVDFQTSSVQMGYNSQGNGFLDMDNGAVFRSKALLVGYYGKGTVQMDSSELYITEDIILAQKPGSTGKVDVLNGSKLEADGMSVGTDMGEGFLTVAGNSSVKLNSLDVGTLGGVGTMSIADSGSSVTVLGNVGLGAASTGGQGGASSSAAGSAKLTLSGGAKLASGSAIAENPASTGGYTVTQIGLSGSGTTWTNAGAFELAGSGLSANSALSIASGASFTTKSAFLGRYGGGYTLSISDANSGMTVQDDLTIGMGNPGTITIESGGSLSAANTYLAAKGGNGGQPHTITVRGQGSRFTNSTSLTVGYGGTGILNIEDSAVVAATAVRISANSVYDTSGVGRINVKGTSGSRGVLETAGITMVRQQGYLNVDGGIIRATAGNEEFLTGFSSSNSFGSLSFGSGGAFFDTNGFDVGVDARAIGSGSLTKTGEGMLGFYVSQAYTGDTYVQAGTLDFRGNSLATSAIHISGGTLRFSGSGLNYGGTIDGDGVFEIASFDTTFTGTATNTGGVGIYNGAFFILGNGGNDGTISGSVYNNGSFIINRSDSSANMTLGSVGGSGSLLMKGGHVTLGSSSTGLRAGTELRGGVLTLGHASALGTANTSIKFTGGTLRFSAIADLSGLFSQADNQQFRLDTNGQNVLFSSGLKSTGGTLTKLGTGTLTLAGENTYSGSTTISQGTVQIGNGGSTGTLAGNVVNNSTLIFNRNTDSDYSGVLSGSGNVSKQGTGTLHLKSSGGSSGALNANGGTINIGNGNTYSNNATSGIGDFAGIAAAISVTGANSRWLNSSDLYVGNLGIGTLNVSNGGLVRNTFALLGRTGSGTVSVSGAYSRWENSQGLVVGYQGVGSLNITDGGYVTNAEAILGGESGSHGTANVSGAGSQWVSSASMTIGGSGLGSVTLGTGATITVGDGTGLITLGSTGTSGGLLFLGESNGTIGNGNGETIKAGEIRGGSGSGSKGVVFTTSSDITFLPKMTGAMAVTLNGTGTIRLGSANTYSGSTSINRGMLRSDVSGSLSANSTFIISEATQAALHIGSTHQTIGSLAGGGMVFIDNGSLTVGGDNTSTSFNGTIRESFANQRASLIKKGTGTFTLEGSTGNSTLGGSVDAGTLVLAKTSSADIHAIERYIDIKSGATLRLAGTGGDQIGSNAGITVNSGGTFDFNGRSEAFGFLGGGGLITNTASNTTSTVTIGENDADTSFSGTFADGANAAKLAFTKVGTGNATLSGTSTIGGSLSANAGTLNITGNVTSGGTSGVGTAGATATLNVSGVGANWTSNADTLFGSNGGTGNLVISNGATASDTFALVGRLVGGTGNVTVTGPGSRWTHTSGLVVGTGGTGTMVVSAGGQVSNTDGTIGGESGSSGTVTVSGTDSLWTSSSYLVTGGQGVGVLNIATGGTVKVGSTGLGTLTLGNSGAGSGTLNIGAKSGDAAVAAGTILAATVSGGTGSGAKLVNFNHDSMSYTFAPVLAGSLAVRQSSGTTILAAANSYTGPTTITGGTLSVGNNAALGTGRVNVDGGTLLIQSGYSITNTVKLSGGTYQRTLTGSLVGALNATSDLGGEDTTVRILAGSTSATLTITSAFSADVVDMANDIIRQSDVYHFSKTGTDLYVLELSVASTLRGDSFLGWKSGDSWVNAVDGNLTGTNNASGHQLAFDGSFALFQSRFGTTLSSYVGAYGMDTATNSTWAVLNHNSDYSVVPEPSTWALLILASIALLIFRRVQIDKTPARR